MTWYRVQRSVRFWWQRRTRGWDDSECWSLDHTIAEFVLPRLKRLKEITHGYPANLTEKKWNAKLDEMITAFEYVVNDYEPFNDAEAYKKFQKGMQTFAAYFGGLWD